MKHSPGPWTVLLDKPRTRRPADRMALVATAAGHMAIDCTRSGESYAQDCANAHLIAAAPDLLAALRMVCDSGVPLADSIESAMIAAIAKAEGK